MVRGFAAAVSASVPRWSPIRSGGSTCSASGPLILRGLIDGFVGRTCGFPRAPTKRGRCSRKRIAWLPTAIASKWPAGAALVAPEPRWRASLSLAAWPLKMRSLGFASTTTLVPSKRRGSGGTFAASQDPLPSRRRGGWATRAAGEVRAGRDVARTGKPSRGFPVMRRRGLEPPPGYPGPGPQPGHRGVISVRSASQHPPRCSRADDLGWSDALDVATDVATPVIAVGLLRVQRRAETPAPRARPQGGREPPRSAARSASASTKGNGAICCVSLVENRVGAANDGGGAWRPRVSSSSRC
jgi:hypothetical protein